MKKLLSGLLAITAIAALLFMLAPKIRNGKPVQNTATGSINIEKTEDREQPKKDTEGVILPSDDKEATITIQESALPDGVSLSDIKMTRMDETELPLTDVEEGDFIAYTLEPNGIEFSEPAIVTVQYDFPELPRMPGVILLGEDGEREFIKGLDIKVDIENKNFTVKAPIDHFSTIAVDKAYTGKSFFTMNVSAQNVELFDKTNAQALVTVNNDGVRRFNWETGGSEHRLKPESLVVRGTLKAPMITNLEPEGFIHDVPSKTALYDQYTLLGNQHTCVEVGPSGFAFRPHFSWDEDITYFDEDGDYEREGTDHYFVHLEFDTPPFYCNERVPRTEMSFEHTSPGKFSTVFLDIYGHPGRSVNVTLTGPAVAGTPNRTGTLESDGRLRIQWQVNQYGSYSITGKVGDLGVNDSVTVR